MATCVLVEDLTEITDCDSVTAGGTWSGITVVDEASDPDPLEGTQWCGAIIKQADDSNQITFTPTTPIDMSGNHLRIPIMTILKPNLKTKALGGIQIIITGGTSGVGTFNVSGGDFYTGGWEMLVCNPYASPDEGTQVVGTVVSIGLNFKIVTAAKNIITTEVDWMSYGTGFYVHGGTLGDEIGMSHIDAQDVYFLLCEERKGVYRVSGKFQIGDSTGTNTTYFKDSGKIIIFEDLDVDADFYELKAVGNGTGTTVVDLSGNFISADGGKVYSVDFTDSTNVTSILLDGTIFQNASTIDLSSVVEGAGTVFDACGAIDPGGATLDGVTIKNSTVFGVAEGSLMVNVDTEGEDCTNMSFQGYTGATTYAVFVAASVTEFDMDNWKFDDPDNTTSCAVYWAGTSGTLTINALNGTNLLTAGCTAASGGSVTVVASYNLTLTGLLTLSDINFREAGTTNELQNTQENVPTTIVYSYGSAEVDDYVDIGVFSAGYTPYYIRNYQLTAANVSIPVAQRVDRDYLE